MRINFRDHYDHSTVEFILDNGMKITTICQHVESDGWEVDENIINLLKDAQRFVFEN